MASLVSAALARSASAPAWWRVRAFSDLRWRLLPGNHGRHQPNGMWDRPHKKGLLNNVVPHLEPEPQAVEGERAAAAWRGLGVPLVDSGGRRPYRTIQTLYGAIFPKGRDRCRRKSTRTLVMSARDSHIPCQPMHIGP